MPFSLGNLGSRVRLQARAAFTNRSVSLCSAMDMSEDLNIFSDDDVDMDIDDSEDEVEDMEQPILPVGAAAAVYAPSISLSSLWQCASEISPAENIDVATSHRASSSSSCPQNAKQSRLGLVSNAHSRTPSAESPLGNISLDMVFPACREQVLTWHPNRIFFAIISVLHQRLSRSLPVRRRFRGKQSSAMEILKDWMSGRFVGASHNYPAAYRLTGRDMYRRILAFLTGTSHRAVTETTRNVWKKLSIQGQNSWGELAELVKRTEVQECAEEFLPRHNVGPRDVHKGRQVVVEDVDKDVMRGYGVALCFNTSLGQDDVQVIRILQSGLSGQELRGALAEVACYSKFIDACWAFFEVLGKESGFPLVACGLEHSENGSHPARVHVHVYMGMEIRNTYFQNNAVMEIIPKKKLNWNGLKPGFVNPTLVARRANSHIVRAITQAYYYVAGPKTSQMLLRCSAKIHKDHGLPVGNTLHIFTDFFNAFRSNLVRFVVVVAIQMKKSRCVKKLWYFNGGLNVPYSTQFYSQRVFIIVHEQEIPIPVGVIWSAWRSHKISDDIVCKEFIRCRDRGAVKALHDVEILIKRTRTVDVECEILRVQGLLQSKQSAFVSHAVITEFLHQFETSRYGVDHRKKCLLLVGDSQQGKSTKALSLFTPEKTLKVSCQGLPDGVVPSLGRFDRARHVAIVWDEIRPDQVLNNRELFQSNAHEQFLQQSVCNQHAYSVWVYHTAQILCANSFDMDSPPLSEGDAQWLNSNLHVARLAPGQRWFLKA